MITISPENHIELILRKYEVTLGDDFEKYLNHAHRIYYYARTLLLKKESHKLAIVSAFHDLDIWVSGNMDYLPGSVLLVKEYLKENSFRFLPDEIRFIINNHHKISRIKGNIEAEAFRKADLIDLTGGLIRFNIPKGLIKETEVNYPRLSFTKCLLNKTLRHAISQPMRPFPMIRL